ncbi:hypothetical protein RUM44_006578, partial [Polyplax serrata]
MISDSAPGVTLNERGKKARFRESERAKFKFGCMLTEEFECPGRIRPHPLGTDQFYLICYQKGLGEETKMADTLKDSPHARAH